MNEIKKKFGGLSVQRKPVVIPTDSAYSIRKNSANKELISAKLKGWDIAVLENDIEYPVCRASNSIVGLKKYFRKVYGAFIVEKPLDKRKTDLPNCYRYRKGAMVTGYITNIEGQPEEFFITDYLNK